MLYGIFMIVFIFYILSNSYARGAREALEQDRKDREEREYQARLDKVLPKQP